MPADGECCAEMVSVAPRTAGDAIPHLTVQERLARAAMELFASACVLSRWDAESQSPRARSDLGPGWASAAEYFLRGSFRRIRRSLAEMNDADDAVVTATADWALKHGEEIS